MSPSQPALFALTDLPVDIVLDIMGRLTPYDVLTLRKTSRLLRALSDERIVWIDVLRSACKRQNVYAPSFPYETMDARELQARATAGRGFNYRIRRHAEISETSQPDPDELELGSEATRLRTADASPLAPNAIRYILPSATEPTEEFENLRFIPGGRFILTSHRAFVRVWDAGIGTAPSVDGPVISYQLPGPEAAEITSIRIRASPADDDNALVIVTSVLHLVTFRVHVLLFSAEKWSLVPFCADLVLSNLDDPDIPVVIGLTSTHISLAKPYSVIVWNFVRDMWVSWSKQSTRQEDTLYICDETIVYVSGDLSEVWLAPLPALQPCERGLGSEGATPPLASHPVIMHADVLRVGGESLRSLLSGVTLVYAERESVPLFFDVMSRQLETGSVLLSHYVVEREGSCSSKLSVRFLGQTTTTAEYRAAHSLHLEWVRDPGAAPGYVQAFIVEGYLLHVVVTDIEDGGELKTVRGMLGTPGLVLNELNVDFCSFSGRVAARVPVDLIEEDGDDFVDRRCKLAVFDYV
ncbi:F-box domain-containing protein [Mycena kentingensis (nom. inval.)]|nr:F-box domain-containing protein [Mycena kentingensis (nom. inval.)]